MAAVKAEGHHPGGLQMLSPAHFFHTFRCNMIWLALSLCHTWATRDWIEPTLPASLCPAPQFVQVFTLLTASTLVQPQTKASKLRFVQSTPGPTGPALAHALVVTTVPVQAGRSPRQTLCLQKADLGWSSGVWYHTITISACAGAATLPFADWREDLLQNPLLCSVCLVVTLAGKVLWRRRHEPVAGLADGHFSYAPQKDSFSS